MNGAYNLTTINLLISISEWIGTAAFAISGALTAIERKLDIFGVLYIGCITATGGGMLRDVLLGRTPPAIFSNLPMLGLAALCSLAIFLLASCVHNSFHRMQMNIEHINTVFDAIGLSVFSAAGAQITIAAGYGSNPVLIILMGMTTAVGGGALRDIMTDTTPYIFVKHVYALASIIGTAVYYILYRYTDASPELTASAAVITVFITRMMAATYHWELPKIRINE